MKFKDYLLMLNEDGEGGGEGGGEGASDAASIDPGSFNNNNADTTTFNNFNQPVASDDIKLGNSIANVDMPVYPIGYFSRIQMPQLTDKGMYSLFLSDLSLNKIKHTSKLIKKKNLTPTQSEFNDEKVQSIKESINNGSYKAQPILVSEDNYIIDGHHRWKAHEDDHDIKVNQVGVSFKKLYNFLQNKPYVINKNVDSK